MIHSVLVIPHMIPVLFRTETFRRGKAASGGGEKSSPLCKYMYRYFRCSYQVLDCFKFRRSPASLIHMPTCPSEEGGSEILVGKIA